MILTIKDYMSLPRNERAEYLEAQLKETSITALAEKMGTYPNRIRRDAKNLGVEIRDRSETRKMLLDTNQAKSPTEGKSRTYDERIRIAKTRSKAWTEEAKKKMVEVSRENWNKKSDRAKEEFFQKSKEGIKLALAYGSKLEKSIYDFLIDEGYNAERQRRFLIEREKMSIDIFLNDLGIAIEIDGPSHHLPVWGEAKLQRTKVIDNRKDGLLINEGIKILRIRFAKEVFLHELDKLKNDMKEWLAAPTSYKIIEVNTNE